VVPYLDSGSNCQVSSNSVAQNYGFQVIHESPRQCPIGVPSNVESLGGQVTYFEALVSAPENVPAGGPGFQTLYATVYDRHNRNAGSHHAFFASDPTNEFHVRADVHGNYYAAQGGFDPYGPFRGEDVAILDVETTSAGNATAEVFLPYEIPQVAINGTPSVDPGVPGQWQGAYTTGPGPYTYSWSVNNQVMQEGPESTFSYTSYTPNSSFWLFLQATDANGVVRSDNREIFVSAGCGTQDECR
jgi:hypothetical protein